jgi:anaerobic ribonucleoside-triphosphate reductase activating protein
MHFGAIKEYDIANGPGVRVSLFVSGCRNHCKGCFQPETWDFNYGEEFTAETESRIIELMGNENIDGLSVLGGDPMEFENRVPLTPFLWEVKHYFPQKNIWVYTGYLYEQLSGLPIMEYIDVLVDGPFIEELKNITLAFRGSENQRIIDVRKTIKEGEVTLYEVR